MCNYRAYIGRAVGVVTVVSHVTLPCPPTKPTWRAGCCLFFSRQPRTNCTGRCLDGDYGMFSVPSLNINGLVVDIFLFAAVVKGRCIFTSVGPERHTCLKTVIQRVQDWSWFTHFFFVMSDVLFTLPTLESEMWKYHTGNPSIVASLNPTLTTLAQVTQTPILR